MWAVEQKHTDAAKLLIEHGADVSVASSPDSKGGTAYLAPTIQQREQQEQFIRQRRALPPKSSPGTPPKICCFRCSRGGRCFRRRSK